MAVAVFAVAAVPAEMARLAAEPFRRLPAEEVTAVLAELPPPLRLVYRLAWRPRYARVSRW